MLISFSVPKKPVVSLFLLTTLLLALSSAQTEAKTGQDDKEKEATILVQDKDVDADWTWDRILQKNPKEPIVANGNVWPPPDDEDADDCLILITRNQVMWHCPNSTSTSTTTSTVNGKEEETINNYERTILFRGDGARLRGAFSAPGTDGRRLWLLDSTTLSKEDQFWELDTVTGKILQRLTIQGTQDGHDAVRVGSSVFMVDTRHGDIVECALPASAPPFTESSIAAGASPVDTPGHVNILHRHSGFTRADHINNVAIHPHLLLTNLHGNDALNKRARKNADSSSSTLPADAMESPSRLSALVRSSTSTKHGRELTMEQDGFQSIANVGNWCHGIAFWQDENSHQVKLIGLDSKSGSLVSVVLTSEHNPEQQVYKRQVLWEPNVATHPVLVPPRGIAKAYQNGAGIFSKGLAVQGHVAYFGVSYARAPELRQTVPETLLVAYDLKANQELWTRVVRSNGLISQILTKSYLGWKPQLPPELPTEELTPHGAGGRMIDVCKDITTKKIQRTYPNGHEPTEDGRPPMVVLSNSPEDDDDGDDSDEDLSYTPFDCQPFDANPRECMGDRQAQARCCACRNPRKRGGRGGGEWSTQPMLAGRLDEEALNIDDDVTATVTFIPSNECTTTTNDKEDENGGKTITKHLPLPVKSKQILTGMTSLQTNLPQIVKHLCNINVQPIQDYLLNKLGGSLDEVFSQDYQVTHGNALVTERAYISAKIKPGTTWIQLIFSSKTLGKVYHFPWLYQRHDESHKSSSLASVLEEHVLDPLGIPMNKVVRMMLANMPAHNASVINWHKDKNPWVGKAHRVHVPIWTNPDVFFLAALQRRPMPGEENEDETGRPNRELLRIKSNPGEVYEFNNAMPHAVRNVGATDRIHLILDWIEDPLDDDGDTFYELINVEPGQACAQEEDDLSCGEDDDSGSNVEEEDELEYEDDWADEEGGEWDTDTDLEESMEDNDPWTWDRILAKNPDEPIVANGNVWPPPADEDRDDCLILATRNQIMWHCPSTQNTTSDAASGRQDSYDAENYERTILYRGDGVVLRGVFSAPGTEGRRLWLLDSTDLRQDQFWELDTVRGRILQKLTIEGTLDGHDAVRVNNSVFMVDTRNGNVVECALPASAPPYTESSIAAGATMVDRPGYVNIIKRHTGFTRADHINNVAIHPHLLITNLHGKDALTKRAKESGGGSALSSEPSPSRLAALRRPPSAKRGRELDVEQDGFTAIDNVGNWCHGIAFWEDPSTQQVKLISLDSKTGSLVAVVLTGDSRYERQILWEPDVDHPVLTPPRGIAKAYRKGAGVFSKGLAVQGNVAYFGVSYARAPPLRQTVPETLLVAYDLVSGEEVWTRIVRSNGLINQIVTQSYLGWKIQLPTELRTEELTHHGGGGKLVDTCKDVTTKTIRTIVIESDDGRKRRTYANSIAVEDDGDDDDGYSFDCSPFDKDPKECISDSDAQIRCCICKNPRQMGPGGGEWSRTPMLAGKLDEEAMNIDDDVTATVTFVRSDRCTSAAAGAALGHRGESITKHLSLPFKSDEHIRRMTSLQTNLRQIVKHLCNVNVQPIQDYLLNKLGGSLDEVFSQDYQVTHGNALVTERAYISEKIKPGTTWIQLIFSSKTLGKVYHFPWLYQRHDESHKSSSLASVLEEHVLDPLGIPMNKVVRMMLANMPAHNASVINFHMDKNPWVGKAHRVHVPIWTNPDVFFLARLQRRPMPGEENEDETGRPNRELLRIKSNPGEVYEFNNAMPHAVRNVGATDRIHLILDWIEDPLDDDGDTFYELINVEPGQACAQEEDDLSCGEDDDSGSNVEEEDEMEYEDDWADEEGGEWDTDTDLEESMEDNDPWTWDRILAKNPDEPIVANGNVWPPPADEDRDDCLILATRNQIMWHCPSTRNTTSEATSGRQDSYDAENYERTILYRGDGVVLRGVFSAPGTEGRRLWLLDSTDLRQDQFWELDTVRGRILQKLTIEGTLDGHDAVRVNNSVFMVDTRNGNVVECALPASAPPYTESSIAAGATMVDRPGYVNIIKRHTGFTRADHINNVAIHPHLLITNLHGKDALTKRAKESGGGSALSSEPSPSRLAALRRPPSAKRGRELDVEQDGFTAIDNVGNWCHGIAFWEDPSTQQVKLISLDSKTGSLVAVVLTGDSQYERQVLWEPDVDHPVLTPPRGIAKAYRKGAGVFSKGLAVQENVAYFGVSYARAPPLRQTVPETLLVAYDLVSGEEVWTRVVRSNGLINQIVTQSYLGWKIQLPTELRTEELTHHGGGGKMVDLCKDITTKTIRTIVIESDDGRKRRTYANSIDDGDDGYSFDCSPFDKDPKECISDGDAQIRCCICKNPRQTGPGGGEWSRTPMLAGKLDEEVMNIDDDVTATVTFVQSDTCTTNSASGMAMTKHLPLSVKSDQVRRRMTSMQSNLMQIVKHICNVNVQPIQEFLFGLGGGIEQIFLQAYQTANGNAIISEPQYVMDNIKPGVTSIQLIFSSKSLKKVYHFPWMLQQDQETSLSSLLEEHILRPLDIPLNKIVRLMLANMPPNDESVINLHRDLNKWVQKTHRIHVPIFTNPNVFFLTQLDHNQTSTGEPQDEKSAQILRIKSNPGEVYEFNNAMHHSVRNVGSTNRVHLILDWIEDPLDENGNTVYELVELESSQECVAPKDVDGLLCDGDTGDSDSSGPATASNTCTATGTCEEL